MALRRSERTNQSSPSRNPMLSEEKKHAPAPLERPAINYPCTWIYKVIGADCTLLKEVIIEACSPHQVTIGHSHSSSRGNYHSLNAELIVPDETVRLKIYDSLKNSSAVKIVL
jgi:hypothetical protein